METNRLFYKKSLCQIEAKDYLEWAYSMLENKYTSTALNILAFLEEPINIFELEQLFQRAIAELKLDEPTYKKQVNAQIQYLLQQIITDKEYTTDNAYELYKIYRDNLGYDEHKTLAWLLITDMVDDFKHGDNKNNYTHELIEQTIVQTATEQLI